MRLALVHDDLVQAGGAERVAARFHEMWPDAPLYTSIYDPKHTLPEFAGADVRTSYLQRTPFSSRRLHKLALPLFPAAIESLDLSSYNVVLSSSSRFAKGVLTPPKTCHICYCHTPARFAWRPEDYFGRGRAARFVWPLMRIMLNRLRNWDMKSADRVDYYIANSHNVAERIKRFYGREATVIYPPIETAKFRPLGDGKPGEAFLVVSRLVGYKRIDLAIEACNRLNLPLRIVGTGPALPALERMAGPTIQLLGRLTDTQIADEYARCRAFIFPGEEDFGIAPLEAMASGRPVVAFGAGGALETVISGETGFFFEQPTAESLMAALNAVQQAEFDPDALRAHALRFDSQVFQDQIRSFVQSACEEYARRAESVLPKSVRARRFGIGRAKLTRPSA
jgi:glycosyltransferase involved in cell wall biosynthesis